MAGLPGSAESLMPPGEDWLVRKVQELERRVNELVAHDVLRAAGVETAEDLFKILGTLQVTGDMLSEGELRVTGNMLSEGELHVTGDTLIEGNLSVPNGSIKNDWLESPVTFRAIGDTDAPVTATTTPTARAVRTMTVPGGYTDAAIVVLGSACIVNTSASTQYVYLRAYAIGTDAVSWWGGTQQITLAAGFAGTLMAPLIRTLPDQTPGDDMTFYVNLWASADLAVHANNWAGIEVQAQFTR